MIPDFALIDIFIAGKIIDDRPRQGYDFICKIYQCRQKGEFMVKQVERMAQ